MINEDDVDKYILTKKIFLDRTATQLGEWPGDEQGARGSGALNKRWDTNTNTKQIQIQLQIQIQIQRGFGALNKRLGPKNLPNHCENNCEK